jgi:hypothetical protein
MKEKQFHGDYYSPEQGKNPESDRKMYGKALILLIAFIVIVSICQILQNL